LSVHRLLFKSLDVFGREPDLLTEKLYKLRAKMLIPALES
jgi:hypothetical protein